MPSIVKSQGTRAEVGEVHFVGKWASLVPCPDCILGEQNTVKNGLGMRLALAAQVEAGLIECTNINPPLPQLSYIRIRTINSPTIPEGLATSKNHL